MSEDVSLTSLPIDPHMPMPMQEVEFLYRSTTAVEAAIEDDIRISLQDFGIRVISTGVTHDEWNTRANVRAAIACM